MYKHKKALLVLGILLSVCLTISVSYAYYIFSVSQEGTNVVRSDCFEITYTDGNAINLSDTISLTDEEARELDPYTFTIKNICNQAVDYNVNIETLNTSTMDLDAVATKLDGKKKQILGSIEDNENIVNNNATSSKTIYSGILKAGEEKSHDLRIWIDVDATVEQSMSKNFSSKVIINGTLKPNYSEAILESGDDFNVAMKTLAGDVNPTQDSQNTSITSIERSLIAPIESDNAVDVSDTSSDKTIFAWFKNGVIYIYSENNRIFMNADSSYMFSNLKSVTSLDLSYIDTSNVEDMSYMFSDMSNLTSIDVSNFNTSNVTDMSRMFEEVSNLTSLDLSSFDTSNVEDMYGMFERMSSLTILDLSAFNTTKVVDMSWMFNEMSNLTNLIVNSFDTSNVTDMSHMFEEMSSLTILDLSSFDTSNVENMDDMFEFSDVLVTIYVSDKFVVDNVINSEHMFSEINSVVGGSGTTYDYTHIDKEYARVDDPLNGKPGYFTLKTN